MKKTLRIVLPALLLGMMTLTGCKSEGEKAVDQMTEIYEQVTVKVEDMDEEDWEIIPEKMEALEKKLSDIELTDEQRKEIKRMQKTIEKEVTRHALEEAGRNLRETIESGQDFVRGLIDGLKDED